MLGHTPISGTSISGARTSRLIFFAFVVAPVVLWTQYAVVAYRTQ